MINNNLLLTRQLKNDIGQGVSKDILDLRELMNYYENKTVFIAACIIR